MIDREKLIKALEQHCDTEADCNSCIYEPEISIRCRDFLLSDCLEALKEQPQWISVKDRLPDEDGTMRGYLVAIGLWVGILPFYSGAFRKDINGNEPEFPVHHWMPLPEPPEGVKQDG